MENLTAKRIKEKRVLLGMSQDDLAKKLHVDRSTVAKWETGDNNLKQSKIKMISEALECSPTWLIGLDNNMEISVESVERSIEKLNAEQLKRIIAYAQYLQTKLPKEE